MRRFIVWYVVVGLLLVPGALAVNAQDDAAADEPYLTVFNTDSTQPVLFQPLGWGAEPDARAFTPRLTLDDSLPDTIYLALENTGWSNGAIGLLGTSLSPDADYVLLEIWERLGNRVLRDDGQGMMFPLVYVEDLSAGAADEPVPGFQLDLLTDKHRLFQLYQVVDGEGRSIWGNHYVRDGLYVQPQLVSYVVDPDPVWGDLVLDVHIIALPDVTPDVTPPTPTPTITPAPTATPTATPTLTPTTTPTPQ